jgi:hypothetical protein
VNIGRAQNITPKASFHVNFGLPVSIANESFKGIMQGLINTSTHFQYTLKNALCFGVGINFTYFSLNEFKITETNKGGVFMPSAFLKVGHEKFHSSNFGTDIGLKMGYTMNYFKSDTIIANEGKPRELGSFYLEPNFGFMLTIDESTTIKLAIGYVIQNFGFRPTLMGLGSNGAFNPQTFNKVTQYLTIGFGYTHYFKSKR